LLQEVLDKLSMQVIKIVYKFFIFLHIQFWYLLCSDVKTQWYIVLTLTLIVTLHVSVLLCCIVTWLQIFINTLLLLLLLLLFCASSSHFLITLAIGAILLFMVLRNVVKIQMPNPTDMFVSSLSNDFCHNYCRCCCRALFFGGL